MAFDVLNLAINDIHLLGMLFQDREEYVTNDIIIVSSPS